MTDAVFEYLLRLGDNSLILGHRLSEWCGTSPILEEDIAISNTALDFIGQTQLWLGLAAERANDGRSADDLAMLRDAWDFRNILLVEQPNGNFGDTMMRQYLFDAWHVLILQGLCQSADTEISAIAQKVVKEVQYHIERSRDLVIRLGDGTAESHAKMQAALDRLWPFVGEMFHVDTVERDLIDRGIIPNVADLRGSFDAHVNDTLAQATLVKPASDFAHLGGKSGVRHSEHLGHLLTQMQWLQRAYPGATW
jgi:ring-1,2-phenylacetyl-CoA epoxidase subunit PaaC